MSLKFVFLLTFLSVVATTASAQNSGMISNGLFGSVEFKLESIDALKKWKRVLERIEIEKEEFAKCDADRKTCVNQSTVLWRDFVKEMKAEKNLTQAEKLSKVNTFLNRWPYVEDIHNWQITDYWATPKEFLAKSGDCEDYAIIKYETLKELGFNPDDMRIAVVMDDLRQIYHAVLVVYDNNSEPLILDSLFDAVLPHTEVLQYTPHYSVNENARWAHIMPLRKGE